MKLAGQSYNSGAVLSRQFFDTVELVAGTSNNPGDILIQKTYNIDPNCPFFYLFAIEGFNVASVGFQTDFEFFNGGSSLSKISTGWGCPNVLDESQQPPRLSVITCMNDGILYAHDPISNSCPTVNAAAQDGSGFVKRWSALADTVVVRTIYLGAATPGFTYASSLLFQGIIQQPW